MEIENELDPIDCAFAEGTPIDQALEEAVREALKHHKRAGNPIVVWRNGEMHWIKPEDIQLPDESLSVNFTDHNRLRVLPTACAYEEE